MLDHVQEREVDIASTAADRCGAVEATAAHPYGATVKRHASSRRLRR